MNNVPFIRDKAEFCFTTVVLSMSLILLMTKNLLIPVLNICSDWASWENNSKTCTLEWEFNAVTLIHYLIIYVFYI